jgi:hypothetical protein
MLSGLEGPDMTIATLPPAPTAVDTPEDFDAKSYALLNALGPMVGEINADNIVASTKRNETAQFALDADGSADDAAAAAAIALAAAASALGGAATQATSTTSTTVSTAEKVFVLVESTKDFSPGQTVVAAYVTDPSINILARVKAYDKPSRTLTLTPLYAYGSGTYANWAISISAGLVPTIRREYDSRSDLRGMVPPDGTLAVVSSLGLFTHVVGSTEVDDDESCFATSTGRWLLSAADMDLVDSWLSAMTVEVSGRMLFGRVYSAVASVGAGAIANIQAYIDGADVGDRVSVCPQRLQTSGSGFMHGIVTAPGTINIQLFGGASGLNLADGFYLITVFKET